MIASHVIEHVPDVIGWLRDLAEISADGAALVLAVPDRRYCFDRHRPQTTLGQAVEAHERGDVVPSIRAVYDALTASVDVKTAALWRGARPPARQPLSDKLPVLRRKLDQVRAGDYVDCHVWTFTPESLLEQVRDLRVLGLCDWYVEKVDAPHGSIEFLALLRRVPRHPDPSYVAPELGPASDLPDWLHDEWTEQDRGRQLEAQVARLQEKLKDRERRLRNVRRRLDELEASESLRVGRAIVGPPARLVRRLRKR